MRSDVEERAVTGRDALVQRREQALEDEVLVGRLELLHDPLRRPPLVVHPLEVTRQRRNPFRLCKAAGSRTSTAKSFHRCRRRAPDPARATPRTRESPGAHGPVGAAADPARSGRVKVELCRDGPIGRELRSRAERRRQRVTRSNEAHEDARRRPIPALTIAPRFATGDKPVAPLDDASNVRLPDLLRASTLARSFEPNPSSGASS